MTSEEKIARLAFIVGELAQLVVFDPRLSKHSRQYVDDLLSELDELKEVEQ